VRRGGERGRNRCRGRGKRGSVFVGSGSRTGGGRDEGDKVLRAECFGAALFWAARSAFEPLVARFVEPVTARSNPLISRNNTISSYGS